MAVERTAMSRTAVSKSEAKAETGVQVLDAAEIWVATATTEVRMGDAQASDRLVVAVRV